MSSILNKYFLVGLTTLLCACNGDSTMRVENNRISAPVPEKIRQISALGNLQLELQVSINNSVVREVPVTGLLTDDFDVLVNVPAEQNNDVKLAWYAITGGNKVLLADFSTLVTAGTTQLTVANYNNTGSRFDQDNDGRTNLSEALDNRNLLSQFDLQVPLQTGFGGVFASLQSDGIDTDISGDPPEADAQTTFSLRHDGSALIVYVCGKDQTLSGDNLTLPGEQYWHDDTIFIFLDGSDSDNNSYDGIDDFQLAFVRDSGEMIVSKGANNAFCPNGDCISHSFFTNSSNCTYELSVTLPLTDLNIPTGAPVGFDLEITDDDNGGKREGSSGWIGYDDRTNLDPRTFGTIILN